MAAPKIDYVALADAQAVTVAASPVISTNRVVLSPGRTKLEVNVVALTVDGSAGVAGVTIQHQLLLQGPAPSGGSLTHQNWYTFATTAFPSDATMEVIIIDLVSLGAGLDLNAGAAYRARFVATVATAYVTVVAVAGG